MRKENNLYEVYHPDAETSTPKFLTYKEALKKQVEWNKVFLGHIARKVKIKISRWGGDK